MATSPATIDAFGAALQKALALGSGPVVVEVDMNAWGPFAVKFAGPPKKKD